MHRGRRSSISRQIPQTWRPWRINVTGQHHMRKRFRFADTYCCAFGIFSSSKTAGRHVASEKDQASIRRDSSHDGRKKTPKMTPRRRWQSREGALLISCHLVGFTTSHRVSILPGTYQHVTLVYSADRTAAQRARCICLSKRTPSGCCLDIRGKVKVSHSVKKVVPHERMRTNRLHRRWGMYRVSPSCLKDCSHQDSLIRKQW
jgi:hypothetical protein